VALTANKWHPDFKGTGRSYKIPYPSPQSILRASVGEENYRFESKIVNTDFVRAAAIIPRDLAFAHLMNTPWSMCYKTELWTMVIVSVADFYSWVDLARSSGAIAWLVGHVKTFIYHWEPPRLDSHKLEIRPPNTLKLEGATRSDYDGQKKEYDKEAVLDLLREGNLTHTEIGNQHGISRITVQRIASRAGIRQRAPHWGGVNV
jgi:hypothetical protein